MEKEGIKGPDHDGGDLRRGSLEHAGEGNAGRLSPELNTNLLSRALFTWVKPMFNLSRSRRKVGMELEQTDIWALVPRDEADPIIEGFRDFFWRAKADDNMAAKDAAYFGLWNVVRADMLIAGCLRLVVVLLDVTQVVLVNQFLTFVRTLDDVGPSRSLEVSSKGHILLVILGLTLLARALTRSTFNFRTKRSYWRARSAATGLVFRQALELRESDRNGLSVGEIINLMQRDAELYSRGYKKVHELWASLLQVVLFTVLLYVYIDWPAFVGVGSVLAFVPVIGLLAKMMNRFQENLLVASDRRSKLTNEVLQGIQGIKMAGWESNYAKIINDQRKIELGHLFRVVVAAGATFGIAISLPVIGSVVSIIMYADAVPGGINGPTLFTTVIIFLLLRTPLNALPVAIRSFVELRRSGARLSTFLALKASEPDPARPRGETGDGAVSITNADFWWTPRVHIHVKECPGAHIVPVREESDGSIDSEPATCAVLQNINLQVAFGEIVAIVGPVGSGKSSLVSAILGEIQPTRGSVHVSHNVAYAAQSAWIFNASVRDNILFGETFDQERYRRVLRACQLERDMELLDHGDETIIGERGINLSGGQRQRISVARVAYSKLPIVLLDDPLSALDPESASKVFQQAIVQLMADRTRILVTNKLDVLPRCDKVLLLECGHGEPARIVQQGRYSDLVQTPGVFQNLIRAFEGESALSKGASHDTSVCADVYAGADAALVVRADAIDEGPGADADAEKGGNLMQQEERAVGAVSWMTYVRYFRASGSVCFAFVVLFSVMLTDAVRIFSSSWVALWSADPAHENLSMLEYILVYAATGLATPLCITMSLMLTSGVIGLRAARNMHANLLDSVLHAPMSFFETTPLGRVLTRFSKDMFELDVEITVAMYNTLEGIISVLFGLGGIIVTSNRFLAAVPVMVLIYGILLRMYRPLMRDAKRLEALSRSPIFAHFTETLVGLSTIRTFGAMEAFAEKSTALINTNASNLYVMFACELWLSVRLELLGAFINVTATSLMLLGAVEGTVPVELAGLAFTFSLTITSMLDVVVRSIADLEAAMNAVDRVLHYTNNIEQEAAFELPDAPPADWPQHGHIEITDLSLRYRETTPLVLKGISLTIEGGERIGIVGRTGSGKSTLLTALLRLVEPEPVDGASSGPICIDGVDISRIGLHTLRQGICIVPQNPVVLSGSVRTNLDPFGRYTTEDMWSALDSCSMRAAVEDLGGLDGKLEESGSNLSQGERQLLCLARAVLSNAKVLLLDEATSSVDQETDARIQATIREAFPDCTVLTIAHRLNTIIDSDRVLVLDAGRLAELDTPARLLSQPDSIFASMVAETGPASAAQLRQAAGLCETHEPTHRSV